METLMALPRKVQPNATTIETVRKTATRTKEVLDLNKASSFNRMGDTLNSPEKKPLEVHIDPNMLKKHGAGYLFPDPPLEPR
jgi:hypothetical protein